MCRQRSDVVEANVEVKGGGNHDFPRKEPVFIDPRHFHVLGVAR